MPTVQRFLSNGARITFGRSFLRRDAEIYKSAFTLLELLIVVMIIAILVAIALPQYTNTLEKARSVEATINIGALRTAMHRYWYEQRAFSKVHHPATFEKLDVDNPNNNTNRFYNYYIKDKSTNSRKRYILRAERIGKPDMCWLQWEQVNNNTGRFKRSKLLGAPEE